MLDSYTIQKHIHNYGIWTAARAASISRLGNEQVRKILENINLKEKIEQLKQQSLTDKIYKNWIKTEGEALLEEVKNSNYGDFQKKKFCFGLAAKLISIYIKTVEVLPTKGKSKLSAIAYSPIDSFLLKNINYHLKLKLKTSWSTFNWQQYISTIEELKKIKKQQPWWKLEVYWSHPNRKGLTEAFHLPEGNNSITSLDIKKNTLRITVALKKYFDRDIKAINVLINNKKFTASYTKRENRSDLLKIGKEAIKALEINPGDSIRLEKIDFSNFVIRTCY